MIINNGRTSKYLFLFFAICFLSGLLFPPAANAALFLSVNPQEGGSSLRFGRPGLPSSLDQQVRIRISSDQAVQFQVFQRLSEPLINERGESLGTDVIVASGVQGSNSTGTLLLQELERVTMSDQVIYTSDHDGSSDAFDIVYHISAEDLGASGQFIGQIVYTLRPVAGGGQDEVVLNLYLDAVSELKVVHATSSHSDSIRLDSQSPLNQEGFVKFEVSGNRGQDINVFAEFLEFPVNEEGIEINPASVVWGLSSNPDSLTSQDHEPVRRDRMKVFSTSETSDQVYVRYQLARDQIANQQSRLPSEILLGRQAGHFKGRLRFDVEAETPLETFEIDVDIHIAKVFELSVTYPPEGMKFVELMPETPAQTREVTVNVISNIGQPYTVTQQMQGLLMNAEGAEIPKENFLVKQELLEGSPGEVDSDNLVPAEENDMMIYRSDSQGSPAQFKVIYQLNPFDGMQPGDYSTNIIFSLGEI